MLNPWHANINNIIFMKNNYFPKQKFNENEGLCLIFTSKYFKLRYSCCTVLCKLQVYNVVIHNF